MKIAVIGANGQLGSDIVRLFSEEDEVIALNHEDIEISDPENVAQTLAAIKPHAVINTAAYHNVPLCEKDPEKTFRINGLGALNLARLSAGMDFDLVHYSTDYVFDGEKASPYREEDSTNPLNIYALTKQDGEILIKNNCRRFFVIRISGIYGQIPCRAKGGNFITTMQKAAREKDVVRVVDDEILTPTPVADIAKNTRQLLRSQAYGLYHMTCQGACSWYEFASQIFDLLALKTPLEPCSVSDFPMLVKRPTYSVLENAALQALGLDKMPGWQQGLESFLKSEKD